MKKIAIYTRQSLDKKDSASIETQIDCCKTLLRKDESYEVYTDKGFSGKNTDRPQFQKMLTDVRNDKIECILCYKLDRISRNLLDFNLMWKELDEHNCNFRSYSESNLDTRSEIGIAIINILMTFAQLERQTTAKRVKDNYYYHIATDGRWAGGPAPFGFENARTSDKKPTLKVNEEEMKIVKFCFEKYAYSPNISLRQIGIQLAEKEYRSRRHNGGWDNVTIARILQSPVYAVADERLRKYYEVRQVQFLNNCPWNGDTSAHIVGKKVGNANVRKYTTLKEQSIYLTNFAGVIDSKTFIMAQERLERNEQIGRSNAPSRLEELAGLLKCKDCGYAIKSYSKSTTGMPYLSCYGRYGLKSCDAVFHGVKFTEIQETVGKEIQKELDKIALSVLDEIGNDKKKQTDIKEKEKQIENLIELASLGGDSLTKIHKRIEEITKQINEIQLSDFMSTRATERLRISDRLPIVYERMSHAEKKSICQQLIEKILLSRNGDIEIIWKI